MEKIFRADQGPRIFISYSFGNELAVNLASVLRAFGYQVNIVDDKMLLGTPSLKVALAELIDDAEVVLPVLDASANRSHWVDIEIKLASTAGKPIVPIVQDETGLSPMVAQIAYLTEKSSELSKDTSSSLRRAIEAFYFDIPVDPNSPFTFDEEVILGFMVKNNRSRPLIRVVIDPFGAYNKMLATLQSEESRLLAPMSERNSLHTTPIEHVATCIRLIDRLQALMFDYRHAMSIALGSYGKDLELRSLTSWQRMLRLVVDRHLVPLGKQVAGELLAEVLGDYGNQINLAKVESKVFERDNSVSNDTILAWAMQYRSPRPKGPYHSAPGNGGWFWCGFATTNGRSFVGFLPACERIIEGVKHAQKPATYIEDYEWADYGLPQLIARGVMLAERFGDESYTTDLVYGLHDYTKSFFPS